MSFVDRLKALFGTKAPPARAPLPHSVASESHTEKITAPRTIRDKDERKRATTQEDARIESEARALFDAGDRAGGIAFLSKHAVLFSRHEATSLPCLCARCLRPDLDKAEAAGVAYIRDFVVARHRAFFYWSLAELAADARQVRASMRSEVRVRLRARATKSDKPRPGMNPFTGKRVR
jgi:hypothetical protein